MRTLKHLTMTAAVVAMLAMAAGPVAADGLIVPVPLRFRRQHDLRLPPYLAVAPSSHYHPALGFLDEPMAVVPGAT